MISPAVDHYGIVVSPHLNFDHFINHISDGLQVRAAAIRSPIGDVELAHLMCLPRLMKKAIKMKQKNTKIK